MQARKKYSKAKAASALEMADEKKGSDELTQEKESSESDTATTTSGVHASILRAVGPSADAQAAYIAGCEWWSSALDSYYGTDNDGDKDEVCDDSDKEFITWDFLSNNLIGWEDEFAFLMFDGMSIREDELKIGRASCRERV